MISWVFFFLRFYLFLERAREGEREGEKEASMCGCLSCAPYWGPGLASNPGMCPDWESNQKPFGLQAPAQSIELHQPGLISCFQRLSLALCGGQIDGNGHGQPVRKLLQ